MRETKKCTADLLFRMRLCFLLISNETYVKWDICLIIHSPLSFSPFVLFGSPNSILIRFNLLFNSGTLWGLLCFDRLHAFSRSLLHCPLPLSIYPLQVFIHLPFILSFFFSQSKKKGEASRVMEGGKDERVDKLGEFEKLEKTEEREQMRFKKENI